MGSSEDAFKMNWLIIIAGFFSGILGAMGLGGGGVLIIYLTLFEDVEQSLAQGINLIFFIPGALIAFLYYIKKRMIKFKIVLPAAITGIIGAFLGSYLSNLVNGFILSKIFGTMLLIMGIKQMFLKINKK